MGTGRVSGRKSYRDSRRSNHDIQQNAPPFLELYGGERKQPHRRDGGSTRAEVTRGTTDPPRPIGLWPHTPGGVADVADVAGRVSRFLPGPNYRDTAPRLGCAPQLSRPFGEGGRYLSYLYRGVATAGIGRGRVRSPRALWPPRSFACVLPIFSSKWN